MEGNHADTGNTALQDAKKVALFCFFLARMGNPSEAAVRAGFRASDAAASAALLLEREEVRAQVADQRARIQQGQTIAAQALQGLQRLAFERSNDAVLLALGGEDTLHNGVLSKLDLFHVSELKFPRGGGCEIKFYDRLAALRALLEYAGGGEGTGGSNLLCALEDSARMLAERGEDDAI